MLYLAQVRIEEENALFNPSTNELQTEEQVFQVQ